MKNNMLSEIFNKRNVCRVIAILMALTMLTFAGCKDNGDDTNSSNNSSITSSQPDSSQEDTSSEDISNDENEFSLNNIYKFIINS